jgi:hypothetical protein
MAGLVPAIHVFLVNRRKKAWMPATSAGMTLERRNHVGTDLTVTHAL